MIVAIVGSRRWPDPAKVGSFVRGVQQKYPDAIIVSGGCQTGKPRRGVDWAAEDTALLLGLRVISFRPQHAMPFDLPRHPLPPKVIDDETDPADKARYERENAAYWETFESLKQKWCVVRYDLALDTETGFPTETQTLLPARWDSFKDAALARNGYVVKVAEQVVAFHDGVSGGTWDARRKAEELGKPVFVR